MHRSQLLSVGLLLGIAMPTCSDEQGPGTDGLPDDLRGVASDVLDADAPTAADLVDDGNDTGDVAYDGPRAPEITIECAEDSDCDDEVYCNGEERCSGSVCYPSPLLPCDDGTSCTLDECVEEDNRCEYTPEDSACPLGQVCDPKAGCFEPAVCQTNDDCDDDLFCNGVERCLAGQCDPGVPFVCDDGNECTADTCDELADACQNVPDHGLCLPTELCSADDGCAPASPCEEDLDCRDLFFCNGTEFCAEDGLCEAGEVPELDDGVACTVDSCSEDTAQLLHTPVAAWCSNGLFCDGAEVCHPTDGCIDGSPPTVSDGVSCTIDSCDEDADFVEHIPDHDRCDDRAFCNGAEVCDLERDCQPGDPPLVNDEIGCTIDRCSEVDDEVIHQPSDELCQDGLFCNGSEVCDPVNDCQAGEKPTIIDGVECTDDSCLEGDDLTDNEGTIVNQPDHDSCQNGLFCDGEEVCNPSFGCDVGTRPNLSDGVGCTIDTCDEGDLLTDNLGRAVHEVSDALCQNGSYCDGVETCDLEDDCQDGVEVPVTDNVPCTLDECSEGLDPDDNIGEVTHTPRHDLCQNGSYCDGAEICDLEDDCVDGTERETNDGVECTVDDCVEFEDSNRGEVTHTPDHDSCQNGSYCDGVEVCDLEDNCVAGPDIVSDGVPCTDDECEEGDEPNTGEVTHTPNHGECQNGSYCDGAETCDPVDDCLTGSGVPISDGVPCTDDECVEGDDPNTGEVTHTPNHESCQDGSFCNGEEICDPEHDCQDVDFDWSDGYDCTTDGCSEGINDEDNLGFLVYTPDDSKCLNGLYCDGAESCVAGQGCVDGTAPSFSDGVGCTEDECVEGGDRTDNLGSFEHTPRDSWCNEGDVCGGGEICDEKDDCQPGSPQTDGEVCLVSPRSICLDETCDESVCGDNYPDSGIGEECDVGDTDDGDGCNHCCQTETIPIIWNGTFELEYLGGSDPGTGPDEIRFQCGYWTIDLITWEEIYVVVRDMGFNNMVLDLGDGLLDVRGAPVKMTQDPWPCGESFDVAGVITGGCQETYILDVEFSDADTWSGYLYLEFTGPQCGITDCTDQTWQVRGTR